MIFALQECIFDSNFREYMFKYKETQIAVHIVKIATLFYLFFSRRNKSLIHVSI